MRRLAWLWLLIPGWAQESRLIGIIQGELLQTEIAGRTGTLVVRGTDNRVVRCSYDEKTAIDRDTFRLGPQALRPGDRLEIVSDRRISSDTPCHARSVHVLDKQVASQIGQRSLVRTYRSQLDWIAPRGNLTFAGVVTQVGADSMVVRTRTAGPMTFLLRQDTRYLGDGAPVELSGLAVNTHVFVRAGKNLDDRVEAFQVVWGSILEVR